MPNRGLPLWLGEVPEYSIVNDQMHIRINGFELAMPINVFIIGCAKGRAAIVQWERERQQSADIITFPSLDRSA